MLSSDTKPSPLEYEIKFEEFREKSFDHLEDYEADNIDKYCKEFLKDAPTVKKIAKKVKRFDKLMLLGIGILVTIFYYISFILLMTPKYHQYFYYFEIVTIGLMVFWYFCLSPMRTHNFRDENDKKDDAIFLKYRGVLEPGPSMFNQLKDSGIRFLIMASFIIGIIAIFSLLEESNITDYLNVVYTSYNDIKIKPILSAAPAVLVIFMFANVIGFIAISVYERKNDITDEKIGKIHFGKMILMGISIAFIIINIFYAIEFASYSARFWENAHPTTSDSVKAYNASWYTIIIYAFVYLGAVGLAIFCIFGLSGLEGGYIKMLYRQKRESLPPEEKNWEYKKTAERHKEEKYCFNRTRVLSAIELVTVIILAVWGYWTLWLYSGDGPYPRNELIYNLMIAELAIVILWVFIFSGFVQYRREKKYYFKDPHQNWKTAEFEERGLGSWKTYYREDIKKKKKLIAYLLYFNLLGLWGLSWNTRRSGGGDTNVMGDIFSALGISPTAVVPVMLMIYVSLNLIFLIYTAQISIFDNSTEGKAYKYFLLIIIAAFTFSSVLIVNAFSDQLVGFNWMSVDFILGMILASCLFGIFAVILVIFIFPVAIRFDNFEAPKKDIILIMINTIVLMAILVALYDFYLPMTTKEGTTIMHGYPYRTGPENQASYKSEYFDLGGYLIHWYGYVWWGFIQQYLFMSYFLRLLQKIFPHSKGFLPAGFSSLIFGIIHFPDWPLMLFTGLAGIMWAYFWQKEYETKDGDLVRGNNLYLWGMVHGFGGTFVYYLIPISMSVGPFNA